jgi:nucleotidyltransferase substrate binding protein (TIGR01987 family)
VGASSSKKKLPLFGFNGSLAGMNGAAGDPDVRWKQRFQSFQRAFGQLRSAVEISKRRELSELETQGLIKAFEFNHELAWKTLKDYLEDRGETGVYGSKDAIRKAFAVGLIEDGEVWMEMIESRNRSTHTYNEEVAKRISGAIRGAYLGTLEKFERQFLVLEASK